MSTPALPPVLDADQAMLVISSDIDLSVFDRLTREANPRLPGASGCSLLPLDLASLTFVDVSGAGAPDLVQPDMQAFHESLNVGIDNPLLTLSALDSLLTIPSAVPPAPGRGDRYRT